MSSGCEQLADFRSSTDLHYFTLKLVISPYKPIGYYQKDKYSIKKTHMLNITCGVALDLVVCTVCAGARLCNVSQNSMCTNVKQLNVSVN